ncbi:chorismate lyase [Vibrio gallicus]|uniref:chorismate lyase n=1 Tax=Vibrio gallicus TaxID=190897 RepID=UPI0021C3401F|nr:chorismate lyase [Vibrio gallicus]
MTSLIRAFELALQSIEWKSPDDFQFPNSRVRCWLLEQDSLSHRLAALCEELSVEVFTNTKVSPDSLSPLEVEQLSFEPCLLREVILRGDRHDWVYGRTLIPQSCLSAQPHDLENQGSLPLGITVFNSEGAYRDALQVAVLHLSGRQLFARRSRLWMNGRPMLVAEIFLPAAPIYSERNTNDAN